MNVNGELRSLVYGRPVSVHVDPIEKKPFYHFLPGSDALSLATSGCPLSCKFCQNWEISQSRPEDFDVPFVSAEKVVEATARLDRQHAHAAAHEIGEQNIFVGLVHNQVARIGAASWLFV